MNVHGVPSETSPARDRVEMSVPCRCCGRPLIDQLTVEETIVAARLTRKEAAVLRAIAGARGNWITSYEIAGIVYADDPDGGPVTAPVIVSQLVSRIKQRLSAAAGLLVDHNGGAGRRLVALPEAAFYHGYRYRRQP